MIKFGKDAMELHDAVAVWCAIENPPAADGEDITIMPKLSENWRITRRKFEIER